MMVDDELSDEYRTQLRDAVEASAAAEGDFAAFHARLDRAVSAKLDEIRRVAVAGHRSRAVAGAAWWDYAARTALAAVPLGLAAALLLLTYLRSGDGPAYARPSVGAVAAESGGADSARAAFESVLTGAAAPQAVRAALIPVPAAEFLAEPAAARPR